MPQKEVFSPPFFPLTRLSQSITVPNKKSTTPSQRTTTKNTELPNPVPSLSYITSFLMLLR